MKKKNINRCKTRIAFATLGISMIISVGVFIIHAYSSVNIQSVALPPSFHIMQQSDGEMDLWSEVTKEDLIFSVGSSRFFDLIIRSKGCVSGVHVNSQPANSLKFCNNRRVVIPAQPFASSDLESNTLAFTYATSKNTVQNPQDGLRAQMVGKLQLYYSVSAEGRLLMSVLLAIALCSIVFVLPFIKWDLYSVTPFVGGLVVRIAYTTKTAHFVRGHDTKAHIDYIQYMSKNLLIPPSAAGWEYHQSPLYYFITAVFHKLALMLGMPEMVALDYIQLFSVLNAFVVAVLTVWIAGLLFANKKQSMEKMLFIWIGISIPALIFLSTRITNNTLYHTFAYLIIGMMLVWWKSEKTEHWYTLCTLIGVGLLVRLSTIVFIPVIGLCLLYKLWRSKKPKLKNGLLGFLIILLIVWWLPAIRMMENNDSRSILKLGTHMSPSLRLNNTIENYTTFSPLRMIERPFNSPWSDTQRRQNFLEYNFRSIFFGEFLMSRNAKMIAQAILLYALICIPLGLIGLWIARKDDVFIPIILIAACMITFQIAYRIQSSTAPSQDFRYNMALIVPMAFFVIRSTSILKEKSRFLLQIPIIALVLFCITFILLL